METTNPAVLTFLLNSVWQVPLIALVAWAASRALANGPARQQHIIWVGAMIAASLLPLASIRKSAPSRTYTVSLNAPEVPRVATNVSAAILRTPQQSHLLPASFTLERFTAHTLFMAWSLFVLFRVARLFSAGVRARRLLRESSAVPEENELLQGIWRRSAQSLGVHSARLRISSTVAGPAMLGWSGTVILPESMLSETSENVLTTAIGHEMAHIARRDFFWNIMTELLWLPIAYHPAALVIRRSIETSREMACDELVTRSLMDPETYARSVMAIATAMHASPVPGCTLGMFDGNQLEERIRRLLAPRSVNLRRAWLVFAACASALVLCIVFASGIAIPARAQSAAVPEMRLAELAFNSGNYPLAQEHFQKAVDLDPTNANARLFLATAIVRGITTGPHSSPVKFGEGPFTLAIQQYEAVLAQDPYNQVAVFGLATFGGAQHAQEAHDRLLAFIAHDPTNMDAYQIVAVSDWSFAFTPIQHALAALNLAPGVQFPHPAIRQSLRSELMGRIDEGIRMLDVVLKNDGNSSNALAFENLLYREAALIADTPEQYTEFIARADSLVNRALQAPRSSAKSEQHDSGKINIDAGPPPSPMLGGMGGMLAPPPPPPPPPPPLVR